MTKSKKIIELENLLKKSEELSSKLLELNNDCVHSISIRFYPVKPTPLLMVMQDYVVNH